MSAPTEDSPEDRMFDALNELIDARVFGRPREGEPDEYGRVPGRPADSAEVEGVREQFMDALRDWRARL